MAERPTIAATAHQRTYDMIRAGGFAESLHPGEISHKREADVIRGVLIRQHATFGIPRIEIVDADFRGREELLLEHRHENVGWMRSPRAER